VVPVRFGRRLKFLVAGVMPHDVEDFLFRTARRFGAVCARISGSDAWLEMINSLEFGAVFVGLDGVTGEILASLERGKSLAPHMPIVTVGGGKPAQADYHIDLTEVQSRLPGIVEKLATSTRTAIA
jgi:hypothetical protein